MAITPLNLEEIKKMTRACRIAADTLVYLQKYIKAGISTDHESYTKEEALEKIKLGMKILIRETQDPLSYTEQRTGGVNIIDLANLHSCAFIATQDLGRKISETEFEVLGRFENSDVRGCNLLVGS